jgi:hypothetical protein
VPFFHEITTHTRCPDSNLEGPLTHWRRVLDDLGMADAQLDAWLAQIAWRPDGSGFVDQLNPRPLPSSRVAGHTLYAAPFVFGYTAEGGSTLVEPWLEVSLLIDSAELKPADSLGARHYLPGVAEAVLQVMRLCSRAFPESGVYFASEAQGEDSWKALHGLPSYLGLWAFELAFVPIDLATRYAPLPATHTALPFPAGFPDGTAFARNKPWRTLPWDE